MLKKIFGLLLRPILLLVSCILMIAGLITLPQIQQGQLSNDAVQLGKMSVYFFDVGQADAALVVADGEAMLIDGGNTADSSLIVSALRRIGISHLSAVICSHAHEDHVGGLSGALKVCTAGVVYAPVTQYDSKAFSNFSTYAQKRGCSLTVPNQGDSFSLGGAVVRFLSPVPYTETVNDTSLVVRVEYGEHSFLFTGDAERSAELQLLDAGLVQPTTVMKVAHHGSDSSTSYVFLRELVPMHAVISVEKDNSYGFPDEIVLSRLADAGSIIYRTDLCGDITFVTDGTTLSVSTEKGHDASAAMTSQNDSDVISKDAAYIGNIRTGKFHRVKCSSLPGETNRSYFNSRAAAVGAGYIPCGICKP